MVLSDGDLTVTAVTSYSVCGLALDAIALPSYFEHLLVDTDGNGQVGFGIGNNSTFVESYLGGTSESVGFWPGPGDVYRNGSVIAHVAQGRTNGTIVRCAVVPDLAGSTASLWLAIDGGDWNGSGTADPVSRVGGIVVSSLAGPIFPAISATRVGEKTTARFARGSWSYAAPSGFVEINAPAVVSRASAEFIGL